MLTGAGITYRPTVGDAEPTLSGLPRATLVQIARIRRRLIVVGVSLLVAIFAATGLLVAMQRANALAEGERTTANLVQVLAEQTSRMLQPIDLTLRELEGRLAAITLDGPDGWRSKALFDLLVERVKGLPQVDALMVIDADGQLVNLSRGFPPALLDVSRREYYQYFSTHDDHALFVSEPLKGYLAGRWTVFLSRRINHSNGAFAGVVMAAVTLSYFEDFYRAVTSDNDAVTLLRRDGVLLVHYPTVEDKIGTRLPSEADWYSIVAKGAGSYRSPGYFGSVSRLVSVQRLREFPLVIDASTDQARVLAVWRRQVLWLLAPATCVAACVVFLLWVFGRQYSRLTEQNSQLQIARRHFDAVLTNVTQGLTLFDANQRLIVCNRRYGEIYGLPATHMRPGTSLSDILDCRKANGSFPDMTTAAFLSRRATMAEARQSYDVVDELCDGRTVSMHLQPLFGDGWVVTHEDITDRCRSEATMAFMVRHDPLTGLSNRTLFQERLTEAIAMTRRGGHCALLCLDLDRFKLINDTLGHPVGDELLRAVAGRLSGVVREGDTVARLGGDEFAIVASGLKSPEHAVALAERIILAFEDQFEIDGRRIMAGTSIGVSIAPKDGTSADMLLKEADVALYLAKAEGRGTFRFFEPEIDAPIRQRRLVEFDLRNALPAEDFVLHYQPVLDLKTGRVTGFEALIRWQHPVRGMVSPAEFIPIAEETGLIVPIGAWALQTACQAASGWPDDIEIAVNLSPVQFKRGHLLDMVQGALTASGLAPNRLELEITELILLENSSDKLALLHQLRALGIRIALDDFGTGYSSLSYLRSFPFDKIKIDQSFIKDVNTNKESVAIVGAVVGLARSLGMTTVAEGLETAQQLTMVRDQGVAKGQGYLFSRPRPADEVAGLIRTLRVPEPALTVMLRKTRFHGSRLWRRWQKALATTRSRIVLW